MINQRVLHTCVLSCLKVVNTLIFNNVLTNLLLFRVLFDDIDFENNCDYKYIYYM